MEANSRFVKPEGRNVNDGIDSSPCSLQYVRIDDVVKQLLQLGPGALMAKLDVKDSTGSPGRSLPPGGAVEQEDLCGRSLALRSMFGTENIHSTS